MRLEFDVPPQEKEFLVKRRKIVAEALQNLLGLDSPLSENQVCALCQRKKDPSCGREGKKRAESGRVLFRSLLTETREQISLQKTVANRSKVYASDLRSSVTNSQMNLLRREILPMSLINKHRCLTSNYAAATGG